MPSVKRLSEDLSPSLRHYLMCGATSRSQVAPCRLPGWPAMLVMSDEDLADAWRDYGAELTMEAKQAGFVPIAAQWFTRGADIDDVPRDRDARRDAWSARFCAEHGY